MTDVDLFQLERRVDALLAPWSGQTGPGATIGVMLDGSLAVHRHAGLANVEHSVPIGVETRFRIASVSKQFTCAAILMLEAEGKLSLDAAARLYLPELPEFAETITVAHLMHNTSGIRDMLEIIRHGGGDLGTPVQSQDLIDGIYRQRTLNFAPGSRFLYSNSNFLLLGLIAERQSGQTLEMFLQDRIFAPLGMRDTRLTPNVNEMIPHLATGYFPSEHGGWTRAAHAFPLGGEGGLVSSVRDLAIWARNFSTKRVGALWLDGLMVQTPFNNGTANRYARGLVVRPYRGFETWSHGGLWPGYRTEFLRVPAENLVVIVIANTGACDPNLLAHRAADAVLETRPGVHALQATLERAELLRLAGRYIDKATHATLDIAVPDSGPPTLTTNGVPLTAEATEDRRLASPRGSSIFAVRSAGPDAVEVEQDAGTTGLWHRVPAKATLPEGVLGTYRSEEMAAIWSVIEQDGRTLVRASGPVATGPLWEVEPVDGDVFRIYTPGTLFRGWLDVFAVREGGLISALEANGGRVKRARFARIAGTR